MSKPRVKPKPVKSADKTVILGQNVAARRVYPSPAAADTAPGRLLEPGASVEHFVIIEHVGSGGMGQVYRALDMELDREVALKILDAPWCHQPEALIRFRTEAQAQAGLRSPYVVTLYSMLERPDAIMLVMEYLDGETLQSRLRAGGRLPVPEAVAVFGQALLGLAHVHDIGVIHRDLKPSNLFLTKTGQVKIMDFGVARLAVRDAYPPDTIVGTLLYISPEQASGRPVDARCDIYALGVSLYEAVTGRLPFKGANAKKLMRAHVEQPPPRPRDLAPLPAALEIVILKAMEKDPDRRYQSAAEFRAALLRLAAPSDAYPYSTVHTGQPARPGAPVRSRPRMLAGFVLDLIALAAIGGILYASGFYRGPAPPVELAPKAAARAAPPNATAPPARARSSSAPPDRRTAAPAPKK